MNKGNDAGLQCGGRRRSRNHNSKKKSISHNVYRSVKNEFFFINFLIFSSVNINGRL